MDCLTDDALSYLIEIILDNSCFDLPQFLICTKIKSISDIVINEKLKRNYKILIKNNYLKCPLRSYYHIHKIYGNNFTLDPDKLRDLICLIIFVNNIELIDIINKTIPSYIKYIKNKLRQSYIDNGDTILWNLYEKLSSKNTNTADFILRNSNYYYIKFKESTFEFFIK